MINTPIDFDQASRIARLDTPFGPNGLVLTRFEVQEGLSELFEVRIDALSRKENINFDQLIGKNCSVSIKSYGSERIFNGVLVEARWLGIQQSAHAYRLILRPWLWLLGRRADCRIFHDKSVIDIVRDVFTKAGFSDFVSKVSRDYAKIPYCVQYRETDLAFVSRLMEEWGVYTYFLHTRERHQLVLADSRSSHVKVEGAAATVAYIPLAGADRRERPHISHWLAERRFRTGKMSANDFDYMKPQANLTSLSQGTETYEKSKLEAYDYPGRYTDQSQGDAFTKVRLEAEQATDRRKYADGDAVSLYPGGLFAFQQHTTDNGQYLVVRATHSFVAEGYRSGEGATADHAYDGHYECLASERPFRAPPITPKPLIHGPQTALVVTRPGKESEEIDVDEEGRIVVQFHWNRDKKTISRPVRVAQMWSGKTWGWQVIPRVGQEVVVEFLDGDPDQPLVVGTVYNKDYRHPYDLPANKTVSGVKTDSSKGHGGYNEFAFEDKKGEETIRMRAEKDHKVTIRHAETRMVGETFETPMGSPARQTTVKKGDDKLAIESGNWTVDVAQIVHITAKMQIILEVGGSKIEMNPGMITLTSPMIKIN